jgi:hypothetical protein
MIVDQYWDRVVIVAVVAVAVATESAIAIRLHFSMVPIEVEVHPMVKKLVEPDLIRLLVDQPVVQRMIRSCHYFDH